MLGKMFGNWFNAEKAIKLVAEIVLLVSYILAGVGIPVALIMGIADKHLWFVSWIIIGAVLFILLVSVIMTPFLWGFGDLVGNVKKLSKGSNTSNMNGYDNIQLPKL